MKQNTILNFLILALLVFSSAQTVEKNHPAGYKLKKQSFPVVFKNFGKVEFASFATKENKLEFYLIKNNNIIYKLPDYYGNKSWAFFSVTALAFRDLNNDGLKDIIVQTKYATGIGPSGSIPFRVFDVYFQEQNGFKSNRIISNELNSEKNYRHLKTLKDAILFLGKRLH